MKTPLPASIKVPKGIVYLGKKGEFKIPASGLFGYNYLEGWSNVKCFERPRDWLGNGFGYYFADKDSEIVRLNIPKPKKNMYTLTKAQAQYYEIKEVEIPAGYRVVKTGEKSGENCRALQYGGHVFGSTFNNNFETAAFVVFITPIKKKKSAPKIPMITITVEGGVVTDVTSKTKVKYKIVDLDNIKAGDSRPTRWEST